MSARSILGRGAASASCFSRLAYRGRHAECALPTDSFTLTTQHPAQPDDGPQLTPTSSPQTQHPRRNQEKESRQEGQHQSRRRARDAPVPKKRRALPGKEQRKTEIGEAPKSLQARSRRTEGVDGQVLGRSMGVQGRRPHLMELGQMAKFASTRSSTSTPPPPARRRIQFCASMFPSTPAGGGSDGRDGHAASGGHRDGPRESRQDLAARRDSPRRRHRARVGGIRASTSARTPSRPTATAIAFVDTPATRRSLRCARAQSHRHRRAGGGSQRRRDAGRRKVVRAANAPIIVAMTIDLEHDNVKQRLTQVASVPEDYGGDFITVPVSPASESTSCSR